jgi:aspartate racemase
LHRTIGILGGMSPESTTVYYEHITREYTVRHGDYGYPEILIYSVNFQRYVDWQHRGQWAEAAGAMSAALERLRLAGADFGIIATNTMHIVFDQVQAAVGMPLLSIVDATATAIRRTGLRTVGLLGTRFTMREPFFRDGLRRQGVAVLLPGDGDQERMNEIIYGELCRGAVLPESRAAFLEIIETLQKLGAEGIVLGCTEIPLLVRPQDCGLPLFNTTVLHAQQALEYAIDRG